MRLWKRKKAWKSEGQMLMGRINIILITVISLIIQGSLLVLFTFNGRQPDLLLIVVVCFSIMWGSREGALVGVTAGLIQDILFSRFLGVFALTKMLAGYLSGFTEKNIYRDFVLGPMLVVLVMTLLQEGLVYILSGELTRLSLGTVFMQIILPKALYNFCLTPFIYLFIYFANEKKFFRPFR
ncbi:rod shape-determining protein MreD [Candidatus Contubernalis alkaliaceticus]|uniref:rod shape-determining protein MreD n=1 Tax=Candidatus Contubernalis alkaliaceticus TaxID=338645 RepID=UPI001F4BD7B5|nr:rod shape-determining protein MreD [Candidatus Contubernalis alkalaceticus]UNC90921.1 rod shape-determining protein MreD [Candidatus Contubernalis alkalaceticus]